MFSVRDEIEAVAAHARLTFRLNKYGDRRARRLGRMLRRCTGNTPCRSGACPKCGLAHQQAMTLVGAELFDEPARAIRGRMTALTIVPSQGCVGLAELTVDLCKRVMTEVAVTIRSLNLPPALLCLDVSFNEDPTGELPPHWSVHVHGISLDWWSQAQKRALCQAFPRSSFVKRPVRIDKLDEAAAGRRYAPKWQRFRRQRYLEPEKPGGRKAHIRIRPKPLRPTQAVRLAVVEHQLGFAARLIVNEVSEAAVAALRLSIPDRHRRARDGP